MSYAKGVLKDVDVVLRHPTVILQTTDFVSDFFKPEIRKISREALPDVSLDLNGNLKPDTPSSTKFLVPLKRGLKVRLQNDEPA